MFLKKVALATALSCLFAGSAAASPIAVDHHVHVHSPAILSFLPGYCRSPGRIGACPDVFVQPLTADDLLATMDRAAVRQAWLMSTAYLAESPMMVPPAPDAAELVRSANAFTVGLARERPDRFVAFIGINPLTSTALPELAFWADEPAAAGVKLHLTNSGLDLRDKVHVARLARVFEAAGRHRKTIMIHMRTRAEDYGAQDVEIFLKEVLPHAGGSPVFIAHSGGWGGLDANTWSAIDAFAEALEREPGLGASLHFDLAQTFDADTPDADLARLAAVMRRIGLERFALGSDWPFSGELAAYFGSAFERLPLTSAERRQLTRPAQASAFEAVNDR